MELLKKAVAFSEGIQDDRADGINQFCDESRVLDLNARANQVSNTPSLISERTMVRGLISHARRSSYASSLL